MPQTATHDISFGSVPVSLFSIAAPSSTAVEGSGGFGPAAGTDRPRWRAVAGARLVMTIAALACVPLAIMGSEQGDTSVAFALLAASLPSVLILVVLRTGSMDEALIVGAVVLDLVIGAATVAGDSNPGFLLLAVAAIAEVTLLGSGRRRGEILGALLVGAAVSAVPLFIPVVQAAPAMTLVLVVAACIQGIALAGFFKGRSRGAAAPDKDMERLRRHLAALRDVIVQVDATGLVRDVGDNVETALRLPATEFMGRGLVDRVHVGDRPAFLKAVSDACMMGVAADFTLRIRTETDGWADYKHVECRCRPGTPAMDDIALVLRDISDAESDRVRLLAADTLRDAALRNRGLFISALSHEVRTPLNAVIGFSDMLASPGLEVSGDTVREYARIINDSGKQLLGLVASTIDLIRLDSGTYEINPEPFAIAGLVDVCVDDIADEAETAGVVIERDVPPFLRDLVADRRAAKQIIGHILCNAVKFSRFGDVVRIAVVAERDDLVVSVLDRGKGIAPEHLAQLADPFFQGDGGYNRISSGAGLGIAVVSRLMALLGGSLDIHSTLGAGTEVTLRFPFETRASAPVVSFPAAPCRTAAASDMAASRRSA